MDSMRSLNTSLPAAYSGRPVPPEQLLQAFKTAALSVTNLYKAAVTDQNNGRAAGYQDALNDLLRFLDSENLGLQDGEGWRVRQWATERYDHSTDGTATESEEPRNVSEERDTASNDNPVAERGTETEHVEHSSSRHQRHDSAPPIFRFTASSAQHDHDSMQLNDEASNPAPPAEASSPPSIQVQLINRGNRGTQRNTTSRHGRTAGRTPIPATGSKRKLQQVPDFFDIANISFNNDREDGAGGKRSRLA